MLTLVVQEGKSEDQQSHYVSSSGHHIDASFLIPSSGFQDILILDRLTSLEPKSSYIDSIFNQSFLLSD